MKKRFKNVISFMLWMTGITRLSFYLRFRPKNRILVLLYHRIRKPLDEFDPAVSPEHFDEQMQFIRRHFRVVSAKEMLEIMRQNQTPSQSLAVITFDDGYRDNFLAALPILKKYGLPATFFLAAGSMDNHQPMWTYRVEALFKGASTERINLKTLSPERNYAFHSSFERSKVCYEVKNEMKQVPDSHRRMILAELEAQLGSRGIEDNIDSEMLSWDEVRQMIQDPLVEIGSHTLSHRMLSRLTGDEVLFELEESKRKIESETGHKITFLSYPGNSYNEDVKDCAKRAHYDAAFAVHQGLASFKEDLFSIRRVHIEDGPLHFFQAEIFGLISFLRALVPNKWHEENRF